MACNCPCYGSGQVTLSPFVSEPYLPHDLKSQHTTNKQYQERIDHQHYLVAQRAQNAQNVETARHIQEQERIRQQFLVEQGLPDTAYLQDGVHYQQHVPKPYFEPATSFTFPMAHQPQDPARPVNAQFTHPVHENPPKEYSPYQAPRGLGAGSKHQASANRMSNLRPQNLSLIGTHPGPPRTKLVQPWLSRQSPTWIVHTAWERHLSGLYQKRTSQSVNAVCPQRHRGLSASQATTYIPPRAKPMLIRFSTGIMRPKPANRAGVLLPVSHYHVIRLRRD